MQLKKDGDWFAPNMVMQFPSLAARYLYEKESDGILGSWHVDVIRESKRHMKTGSIPCKYFWEEKTLKRISDISEEQYGTNSNEDISSGLYTGE
jgi:hypothetical protein